MALTAQDLKSVIERYHQALRRHEDDLNRLNVYPVPDGDTGTNMTLTVASVVKEVDGAESIADVAEAFAHGSLMGARGNSGVILSQILRGLADVIRTVDSVEAAHLAEGLRQASAAAYEAVMRPVEGTILTVLRDAAEAAAQSGTGGPLDIPGLAGLVYQRARESLEGTPELLPVLKQAGVVDAGGAGLLLLLAALLEEVSGQLVALPGQVFTAPVGLPVPAAGGGPSVADLRYEVMFLLEADEAAVAAFKEAWRAIGDSIVVVGGRGTYNCHIHTDDIGAAVEAGVAAGRPSRIRVTDLLEQAGEQGFHHGTAVTAFDPLPEFRDCAIGVVAIGAGDGVAELFRSLGAQGMVLGGQTMNPSLAVLLDVVEAVPADRVVLLPNNKNIVPVAVRADEASHKEVAVVPTRSVPAGLAAMIAFRPDEERLPALVASMTEAAGSVRTGELTRAVRAASTPAGEVAEDDWLGLADGEVAVIEPTERGALLGLVGELVDEDAELLTIITGEDADADVVDAATAWLADHFPGVEPEVVAGGQPLYPYLLSVE